jgi:transcriptional regulator with XRE-family HTH domain
MNVHKKFGGRVRHLRRLLNITQEELAARSGLDAKSVGCIERGERNITLRNITRLAQGLQVEPYELLLFDYEPLVKEEKIRAKLGSLLKELDEKSSTLLYEIGRRINAIRRED